MPAADPTLPQLGTLTVVRGRAPTTYLVGFSDDEPATVLLAKQDAAADVYAVRLKPDGTAGCTCPGFRHHAHCCHADAVLALLADGTLTVPAASVVAPF